MAIKSKGKGEFEGRELRCGERGAAVESFLDRGRGENRANMSREGVRGREESAGD